MWHELPVCNMPNKNLRKKRCLVFIVKSDCLHSYFSHINMFCHSQATDKELATGPVFGSCFLQDLPNKASR